MSTIDPRVARAQKAEQSRSSGRSYLIAVIVAVVHTALWGLAGFGGGMILDTFRLMSINQVGAWDGAYSDTLPWLFFVGVFVGAATGFALTGRVTVVLGGRAGMSAPFFTAFLGLAIGLGTFFPAWTAPQSVGFQNGFIEGDERTAWGVGAWIMYSLPWLLPTVFGVIALLALIGVIRGAVTGRRRVDGIRSMVQTGTRIVGDVSEVVPTGVEVAGNPYVQLTVHYRDAGGTERWVTKRHAFPPTALPRTGDVYTVWYDPLDPANEKKIVIAPGDSDGTAS
jgi:hypothetical protein